MNKYEKKIFIVTIPMLPEDNLKALTYRDEAGHDLSFKTKFPGIAMLENNIYGDVDIQIVVVRTNDDNGHSKKCLEIFKNELDELSQKSGVCLKIANEILISHSEDEEKEKMLLRELFDVSNLYHTVRFMETSTHMNNECFKDLMENMVK